jgi:PhoPQ-activated pathogenicity-related protein
MRFLLPLLAAACLTVQAHADLFSYVARPEPKSNWKLVEKSEFGACDVYKINLVSQEWQGILWDHDLVVFRPKDTTIKDRMYLMNNGGKMKPQGLAYGAMLATQMKAPVAILLGIPNQPLFDGKREDDLIAETFVRYLETKDDSWPLLFPMVKSLVKAMDALGELSEKEWGTKTDKFVVGGASKRGWTSWLTAAADPRVIAVTPMVIDVLRMPEQMKRQVECFGGPSEQIRPYVARQLVPMPETPEAQQLWKWVDPFTYRAKYTMPKLIVLGNNDRYWAPDALNLYWDEIPGPKWISYTPNAGHNLTTIGADGKKGDPMRAVNATAAFTRYQLTGQPLPELTWKHDDADGKLRLVVTSNPAPKEIHVWRCSGPTKDLRDARWESQLVPVKDGRAEILEPRPTTGVVSFFADCSYEIDGLPYTLCTQLRLVEAGKGGAAGGTGK